MHISSAVSNFLAAHSGEGLAVYSPLSGEQLTTVAVDDAQRIADKIAAAVSIQTKWKHQPRKSREDLLHAYAQALKAYRETMGELIALDAGKTPKEALAEADSASDITLKTINDARLPELSGMLRTKECEPIGVVGLITSFNFPLVVAQWTIAPALLAGNAVLWKPSEKTVLAALYAKQCFDAVVGEYKNLLQLAIGGREVGEALVGHEQVDMVSATGSVAMGQAIKRTLAVKKNNAIPPILELGGNNAVAIGKHMTDAHLEWSIAAIMQSFLGTTGQRCTNTRRLIVHQDWLEKTISVAERLLADFINSGTIHDSNNAFGYNVLIDADAYHRFESAKKIALEEGERIVFGAKLVSPDNVYKVEPALAIMPAHTPSLHHETFAPLLYIVPYAGDMDEAMRLVNAPENAGLVNAIYTLSQAEADVFVAKNQAGHTLINSPKGTGTPAYGMGFGGNKASGCGEILNSVDPLSAFTQKHRFTRIAQNKDIHLSS